MYQGVAGVSPGLERQRVPTAVGRHLVSCGLGGPESSMMSARSRSLAVWSLLLLMLITARVEAEPFETIINNGSPQNRLDIAVLGDGYTAGELQKYKNDVQSFMQGFFAQEPFKEYQYYFNVHRIDVTSSQSGADHPERGVFVSTALDATYNCQNIQRLICINSSKLFTIISNTALAPDQFDLALVIVNDDEYGGSGGSVAVASTNAAAVELILHEEGHTLGLLGDEYAGGGPACNTIEPSWPNVTAQTQRSLIKWNHWIDSNTPLPTTSTAPGVPGLYQGAGYCDFGLYRPTYNSKMRNLLLPFEQINVEQLIKRIHNFVSPLDSSTPAVSNLTLTQGQTQVFSVSTPVPFTHVLRVTWSVDGQQQAVGPAFTLDSQTLSPGNHSLSAVVSDPTVAVRSDPNHLLMADRSWGIQVNAATTTVLLSAANYNVGEGGGSVVVSVTRSGDTSGAATVDFLTSDGTATQSQDYVVASGTLSFAAGETSKTFNVLIVDDSFIEANETLNVTLSNPVGAVLAAPSTATITIIDNDTAGSISPAPKRFATELDGAQETPSNSSLAKGSGLVLLNQAETSALVGLQFQNLGSAETAAHIHGPSGPGVAAPILFPLAGTNPVTNFAISPTAQQVADLKAHLHYQNVHSTNFPNGEIRGQLRWNPTLEENFFVRQQYLDFLSRDGDPSGFNFWVGTISPCQADVQCFHDRSIAASDAFFFEPEFQQTAGFVFRAYRAAFGNTQPSPNPDNSNPAEANKLVDYSTFVADRARVVGGANLAAAQQAFANLFVTRSAFTTKYAGATTGPQFVDAILATIQTADGVDLSGQRQALIDQYNLGGRGMVLYRLSDHNPQNPINNQAFINAEYNRQFALTLYFGYLRRNPDIGGFLFWQDKINLAPVRDVPQQNALVCWCITAGEYHIRFGLDAPRTNAECPQ